jgi:glycerophosphoryl diester phosphodiesterase
MPKLDPFFGVRTPVIFAHRGGGGEAAQSTELAFRNAAHNFADVLEIDLQITKDEELVVWHGPDLDGVYNREGKEIGTDIRKKNWSELEGAAWVANPGDRSAAHEDDRLLMTLETFMRLVDTLEGELVPRRVLHVNIELKAARGDRWQKVWADLFKVLDKHSVNRKVVVVSAKRGIIERFRKEDASHHGGRPRYATGLATSEQMAYRKYMPAKLRWALHAISLFMKKRKRPLSAHPFETTHGLVTRRLVDKAQTEGGAVFAFLTRFGYPPLGFGAIDDLHGKKLRNKIETLLDKGVDGVMTDYPRKVAPLVCDFRDLHNPE